MPHDDFNTGNNMGGVPEVGPQEALFVLKRLAYVGDAQGGRIARQDSIDRCVFL